jgi:pilus assembly protein Flp/PilA
MLNFVIQKALSFTKKEDGATAIEYGLIAALIAVAIIAAVTLLGTSLSDLFNTVSGELEAAGS